MAGQERAEITGLLMAWGNGNRDALGTLMPLVYEELHRTAERYMRRERPGHTLQTTALVNEAYVKLIDASRVRWQDRAHFFAVAAQLMRRILVDFARRRRKQKRSGGWQRVTLAEELAGGTERPADLVALDEALEDLSQLDPRKAHVVELRFFGGLSLEETAAVLGVSTDTIGRDWSAARAWLLRELRRRGRTDATGGVSARPRT
jgi:RNA polymerase sigma factor (TIGR02999 family)